VSDEISYARTDDTHVAYRQVSDGDAVDLVAVSGTFFPMEVLAEDRVAARFTEGLAALGRLVVFDKRGIGLSDPFTDWSRPAVEQWADDLIAVIETSGLERPIVVSWDLFGPARRAAARRPDLIGGLVLINPVPTITTLTDLIGELSATHPDAGPGELLEDMAFPSRIDEPGFRAWLGKAGRLGASPATASRLWEHVLGDVDDLTPPDLTVPTMVIHNRDAMNPERQVSSVADAIEGGRFVQIPGVDVYPIAGDVDAIVAEVAEFGTGTASVPAPTRRIAAVLFTDLVSSTARAVDEGDARWRDLLDEHDTIAGRAVARHAGRVVKSTGDGVLALLPSATAALETAAAIRRGLADAGLAVRAGVHVGDIDERGDDVSGLVVNVAARIMDQADADRILVSESVRRATIGSGLDFGPPRTVQLKGLPEDWTICEWLDPD